MALPRIVEYLVSIRRKGGGGPLVTQGQSQTIINTFPPNTTVSLQAFPFGADYLDIFFEWAFDPAVVPNAFYAYGSYYGARPWEGIAHSWWMQNNISGFVLITESEPAYALIYNRTPVAQYYAGTTAYLAIKSAEDFDEVYDNIAYMATSAESESLARQSVDLLTQINQSKIGG